MHRHEYKAKQQVVMNTITKHYESRGDCLGTKLSNDKTSKLPSEDTTKSNKLTT